MVGFRASAEKLLPSVLAAIVVLVAHGVRADVERQANGLSGMLHITASLNDVFRGYGEGSRTVLLLEASCEEALMVVLPF